MTHETTGKRWYLVYAEPQKEELARVNLERQSYAAYLPRMETPQCRLGERIIRVDSMLPRALFTHLDTEHVNRVLNGMVRIREAYNSFQPVP